jgi:hypothetical protein
MVGSMAPAAPPGVAWHWTRFGYGAVLAIPAAVVTPFDPQLGLAFATGVLPAAAVGLPPARRRRVMAFVISAIAGMSMIIGALLGRHAVVAVVGLFVLSVGASLAASRMRGGRLGLQFAVPLMGIGLSFDSAAVFAAAGVMALGGLYAWLVSLLWPEHPPPAGVRAAQSPMPRGGALTYGILLGLAGATAAAVGFALDLDHKGWVCGAALLVMRPDTGQLVARGLGRAGSVLVGALLGSVFVALGPTPVVIAAAVLLALAALAGTTGSRWYITPAFTTFVVFILLLWDHPTDTAWRFLQRNLETVAGVIIALLYGVVLPLIIRRLRPASVQDTRSDRGTPAPAE